MVKNPFLDIDFFTSESPYDSSPPPRLNHEAEIPKKFSKHGFSFFNPNIPQPYTQFGRTAGVGTNFIPQTDSPFGNPLVLGGKMFGRNPYHSSSQQTQFQPFFPGTNTPGINAYGGGSNPYHFQQN